MNLSGPTSTKKKQKPQQQQKLKGKKKDQGQWLKGRSGQGQTFYFFSVVLDSVNPLVLGCKLYKVLHFHASV